MRLGVLGGTFDPIHIGHLILAEHAREQFELERVLFVPAGEPWRKAGRSVTPAEHRLAMTRLAVADNPYFEVDDLEVRRAGPSYTVETLHELRGRLSAYDELFFLVGEDALADLPNWKDPPGIAGLAWIVVAPRQGVELPPLPFDESRLKLLRMPYIGISSTEVRERLLSGKSARYMVPDRVLAYVGDCGLYRGAAKKPRVSP